MDMVRNGANGPKIIRAWVRRSLGDAFAAVADRVRRRRRPVAPVVELPGPVFLWREPAGSGDMVAVLRAPDHPGTLGFVATDRDGDAVSIDLPVDAAARLGQALRGEVLRVPRCTPSSLSGCRGDDLHVPSCPIGQGRRG